MEENNNENNNENNSIINKIIYEIRNYFINYNIIINDDDDIYIKFKKFLLKYKRIIGLVLLIILLILGYYCNPYDIDNGNGNGKSNSNGNGNTKYSKKNKIFQNGGDEGNAAPPEATPEATPEAAGNAAGNAAPEEEKKPSMTNKLVAEKDAKVASAKASLKNAGKGLLSAPSKMFDAAGSAAHAFSDNAGVIYQVLYAIAITAVIGVVLVPSVALVVIGLICYILLKDKMKTLKSL